MSYVYPTRTTQVSDSFADHQARGSVNPGTDYVVPKGSDVFAIAPGVVRVADGNPDGSGGRTICIYHDDGSSSDYLHLDALSVSVGSRVVQGQRIGFSGNSGTPADGGEYGAHLHISFRPHNQIDWFGNVGNADFDAAMRSLSPSGGGATPIPEEDDPLSALTPDEQRELLTGIRNLVGYTYAGGPSVEAGRNGVDFAQKSVIGRLNNLENATIVVGGPSMPDHGRSLGASLAWIVKKLGG